MITNTIVAIVTAYCACKVCCGPNAKGICANGKAPVQGTTIAASRRLPLGTEVWIDSHKYIVHDRLAKKYYDRFDIFFSDHQVAKNYGKQTKKVTIIRKD